MLPPVEPSDRIPAMSDDRRTKAEVDALLRLLDDEQDPYRDDWLTLHTPDLRRAFNAIQRMLDKGRTIH